MVKQAVNDGDGARSGELDGLDDIALLGRRLIAGPENGSVLGWQAGAREDDDVGFAHDQASASSSPGTTMRTTAMPCCCGSASRAAWGGPSPARASIASVAWSMSESVCDGSAGSCASWSVDGISVIMARRRRSSFGEAAR